MGAEIHRDRLLGGNVIYYSKTAGGFFSESVHTDIPADAVEISQEQYTELLQAQARGSQIVADGAGWPILLPPPPPPDLSEVLIATLRRERNKRLTACDWTQLPDSPLTDGEKTAWRTYRQALRDMPAESDPANPVWPQPPQVETGEK